MIGIRVTNLGGVGRLNHVLVCGGVNAWLPQHEPPIPIPVGQRTMVDIVFTPALNHPQLTVVFQVIVMDADGVSVQDRTVETFLGPFTAGERYSHSEFLDPDLQERDISGLLRFRIEPEVSLEFPFSFV
ncbi:MAG TPA: hypothetical protein VFC19_36835 [Candidatus Limnocylindrales bacterium]|nr:hypothetical protein [Candidatus Limnocylindrales bacterium]